MATAILDPEFIQAQLEALVEQRDEALRRLWGANGAIELAQFLLKTCQEAEKGEGE